MKAFVLTAYGSPDALQLQEATKPEPAAHQVLVKVRTTAINDWDWTFLRGRPRAYRPMLGLFKPKVRILGAEIAGEVAAVGSGASKFRPGDAVYGDISESGFGGFAEFVCVDEDALCLKPTDMSFEEAAAIPHAALLALQGFDAGGIRDGQRILINGAGGGVGTLGVQLAKQYDVDVTGIDSAEKLDLLRSVGFDQVIDYRQRDFTENGPHYDLILDTKSNRPAFEYTRALAPKGTYVTVGGDPDKLLRILALGACYSMLGNKHLRVLALRPNQGIERVNDLYQAGKLGCAVDGPYPFTDIPRMMQYYGEAKHKGKVVIRVSAG